MKELLAAWIEQKDTIMISKALTAVEAWFDWLI